MQSNQCQLIEPHEPLVILVEYDMCSLLQFPHTSGEVLGLGSTSQFDPVERSYYPKFGVIYPLFDTEGYLFYTKYVIYFCIVF